MKGAVRMKKTALLLLFAVFFSFSSNSFAAQDPKGFKGYPWGTDFWTIDQEKELKWDSIQNRFEGVHISMKDTKSGVSYRYVFFDNQLIGGIIVFPDEATYTKAMNVLYDNFGQPNRAQGYTWWFLSDTQIKSPFFSKTIELTSVDYLLKVKTTEDKKYKAESYNEIFN